MKYRYFLPALIFILTFLIFSPALQNKFVNWDDNSYVYDNNAIKKIDTEFIKYLLFNGGPSNWHPFTMLSHAVDYTLWGENPLGHHLTSIILHSLNTVILFFFFIKFFASTRLDKYLPVNTATVSLLASLFFGLHPLRVESVAWVSERKDVLCGFFFFLSLLAYLYYRESRDGEGRSTYLLSLMAFALALLSKPMAVTLPFVLLLIDYYLKNRRREGKGLPEKMPFFAMSLLISLVTFYKQYEAGSVKMIDHVPAVARIGIATKAYLICLLKTALPFNLGPLYPLPFSMSFWSFNYLAPIITVFFLTAALFTLRIKYPAFFSVWLYLLITLLPVAGLVSIGGQLFADRYSYIPSIAPGVFISISWLKIYSSVSTKASKRTCAFLTCLIILLLSLITFDQVRVWQDSRALWTRGARLYPKTGYIAYTQMGLVSMRETNYGRAIREFNRAISIYEFPFAVYHRGLSNLMLGNYHLAGMDFDRLLKKKPDMLSGLLSTATHLQKNKKYDAAIFAYEKYLQIDPDNIEVLKTIGSLYLSFQNKKEAARYFSKAAFLEAEGRRDK